MAEPGMTIKVEGLKELREALKRYPKEWPKIAAESMEPGVEILEAGVVEEAPVLTGKLRSQVGSKIVGRLGSEVVGEIGSTVDYAPAVEKRKPFMAPVLKRLQGRVVKLFEKGISRALKRIFK